MLPNFLTGSKQQLRPSSTRSSRHDIEKVNLAKLLDIVERFVRDELPERYHKLQQLMFHLYADTLEFVRHLADNQKAENTSCIR